MLVTVSGIIMDLRLLQFWNARSPMLVTESGIVTDNNPRQPENADAPILVEPTVTTAFVMILYEEGNIDDRQNRPGIVVDVRPLQFWNA
jgi:hypothetical protein